MNKLCEFATSIPSKIKASPAGRVVLRSSPVFNVVDWYLDRWPVLRAQDAYQSNQCRFGRLTLEDVLKSSTFLAPAYLICRREFRALDSLKYNVPTIIIDDVEQLKLQLLDLFSSESPDALVISAEAAEYLGPLGEWLEATGRKPWPTILITGDDLEFSGSTLPVAASFSSGRIYLSNHFSEYFGLTGSLLASVNFHIGRECHRFQELLGPRQTKSWDLAEIPGFLQSGGSIHVNCFHPRLSGGRHFRWRFWADLHTSNGLTSLHSAHDYGPSREKVGLLCHVGTPDREESQVKLVIPNYFPNAGVSPPINDEGTPEPRVQFESLRPTAEDSSIKLLERPTSRGVASNDGIPYTYFGFGGAFWFETSSSGDLCAGNHEVRVETERRNYSFGPKSRQRMSELRARSYVPHIHFLPVASNSSAVSFDLETRGSRSLGRLKLFLFNDQGDLSLEECSSVEGLRSLQREIESQLCPGSTSTIGVCPDFYAENLDPRYWAPYWMLLARNRHSHDCDVTEFQNSWRNLGEAFPDFPHWLSPRKAVQGSSRLWGRWNRELENTLWLVNGSGNLEFREDAKGLIEIYDMEGRSAGSTEFVISPFSCAQITVNQLLDTRASEDQETIRFGAFKIVCSNSDLNGYLTSVDQAGGTGLQHLWGY